MLVPALSRAVRIVKRAERESTMTIRDLIAVTKRFKPGLIVTAKGSVGIVKRIDELKLDDVPAIGFVAYNKDSHHRHLSVIHVGSNGKARVSCDCEMFMFHCEVALYMRGVAHVAFSNGAPPNTTNPGVVPYVCPHLLAAFAQLRPSDLDGSSMRPIPKMPKNVPKGKGGVGVKISGVKVLK